MEETTLRGRAVRDITWEEFRTLFLGKFFPRYSKDRQYQEFLSLTQGEKFLVPPVPGVARKELPQEQGPKLLPGDISHCSIP